MPNRRHFTNPFLNVPEEPSSAPPFINESQVKSQLFQLAQRCLSENEFDSDGGLYVGAAGVAYMYVHIRKILTESEDKVLGPAALELFQAQLNYTDHMTRTTPKGNHRIQFLLGSAGIYALGTVLGHQMKNQKLRVECLQRYTEAASVCKPLNFFRHGGDELFVGRAGYLMGALWLEEMLGMQPVPAQDLLDIWTAIVESGRTYARSHRSPCPLLYSYYDTEYLGAAHGIASIIQVLLSFPGFLDRVPGSKEEIRATIDFYLSLQDSSGNFPCAMDEIGVNTRSQKDQLVHWCHGAPGAVYMFAKAYLTFRDDKYLAACVRCAEVVWNRGLLKKGPGICHGIAGNGYVFLLLHRLLNEPVAGGKYYWRAAKFYNFMNTEEFKTTARTPDAPYSLYEGFAGTICYLADLIHPDTSVFPFSNVFFSSSVSV